jgi:hypothetical protein
MGGMFSLVAILTALSPCELPCHETDFKVRVVKDWISVA